jgi:hypothetical protein
MKYQKSVLDAVPWKSNVRLKPDIDALRKCFMRSFRPAVVVRFDAAAARFDAAAARFDYDPRVTCDWA